MNGLYIIPVDCKGKYNVKFELREYRNWILISKKVVKRMNTTYEQLDGITRELTAKYIN